MADVRLAKCVVGHETDMYALWDVVFTPDGKGLFGTWKQEVLHWDVSWLASTRWDNTDGQRKGISGLKSLALYVAALYHAWS